MPYNLIFKEEAKLDIKDAFLWYETKLEGLGLRFIDELENFLLYISENPFSCETKYRNHRVAVLKVFPYVIVYQIEEKSVVVYAVFATSKNPDKLRI